MVTTSITNWILQHLKEHPHNGYTATDLQPSMYKAGIPVASVQEIDAALAQLHRDGILYRPFGISNYPGATTYQLNPHREGNGHSTHVGFDPFDLLKQDKARIDRLFSTLPLPFRR